MKRIELWVNVMEFEGYYQVSNMGRIRSLDRYEKSRNGFGEMNRFRNGKILHTNKRNGRECIGLYKHGEYKMYSIHRLVYESFHGKIKKGNVIHHIDSDINNNKLDNLQEMNYSKHNLIHKHIPWNKGIKMPKNIINKWVKTKRENYLKRCYKIYNFKMSGWTIEELAKKYNCTTRTIYQSIKNYKEHKNEKVFTR